jgi:asparagine synthase (glutamine-hydrolysing)
MLSGFELRAPFLDREVMEFAASLPPEARVSGLTTKVFLKRYALRYLPREVVMRRKRGLSVPLAGWLRKPLLGWAESRLASGRLAQAGVSRDAALGVLAEHRSGQADHSRLLWSLLVLVEWLGWVESLHCKPPEDSSLHPAPPAQAEADRFAARAQRGWAGVGKPS